MMVPTELITLPTRIRTGPTAATSNPTVTMIFFVPSSRELSQSTKDWIQPTMALIYGIRSSPMEIASPSIADLRIVS